MSNLYYKGNIISVSGGSELAGMRICAVGDSNTQYMGENLNNRIVELTGCASVRNEGHAGATWSGSINLIDDMCAPYISKGYADEFDIVTIMLGTNGDSGGIGDSSSTDTTTTWGAMKHIFDKLLYYYRYGKIGVLLPPQRAGGVMTETVAAVRTCCELYSVPYYDISGQGQIPSDARMPIAIAEQELPNQGYGQIYFGDNVHLSSVGHEQFYRKYAAFLRRLVG